MPPYCPRCGSYAPITSGPEGFFAWEKEHKNCEPSDTTAIAPNRIHHNHTTRAIQPYGECPACDAALDKHHRNKAQPTESAGITPTALVASVLADHAAFDVDKTVTMCNCDVTYRDNNYHSYHQAQKVIEALQLAGFALADEKAGQ